MTVAVPDRTVVVRLVEDTLARTYDSLGVLIDEDTNERSILFHVGRYMAEEVAKWGGPWRVDLEYNCLHGLEDVARKYLHRQRVTRRVYPDLIIHDPSGCSSAHNLLVLEAKKVPRRAARIEDCNKLLGFRQQLSYRYAAYVELRRGAPRLRWVDGQSEDFGAPPPLLKSRGPRRADVAGIAAYSPHPATSRRESARAAAALSV
jgi:hypothetical protein